MIKQLTLYIVIAFATILGGCNSDYDGPEASNAGDALELSISCADATLGGDGSSRASESGYAQITVFESGDVVGLTVLGTDDKGEDILLADNVPYKFDGKKWDVDTDLVPESRRVYFEKTMHTYIVYYPYKPEGRGCNSIMKIKEKCFPHQENQTEREAYILSDPMGWVSKEKGIKKLNVVLRHMRNSIMLDPKVRWKLINDKTITYQPLREALEVFTIRNKDGKALQVYHAPDSTYRYILPDDYTGEITWRYAYRYYKFVGSCEVKDTVGVRYVQDEVVDMGTYDTSKALELDCFCKDADDNSYILPWDAVALLKEDEHRCVGVVHYLGHNLRDGLDYSKTPVGTSKCHGYVLALTNSHPDQGGLEWDHLVSIQRKEYTGTNSRDVLDQENRDWNGYANCDSIQLYIQKRQLDIRDFPALESCLNYGSGWQEGLEAPRNTTGWFLPSDGILHHYLSYNLEKLRATNLEAIIRKRFEYIKMHIDDNAPYKWNILPLGSEKSYSTSTEIFNGTKGAVRARLVFGLNLNNRSVDGDYVWKNEYSYVRPVLIF